MKKIELIALSKTYHTAKQELMALDRVSLAVEEGEIYGIIGLSGAGKSTLIRCMASLLSASSGKVLFEGSDLNAMTEQQLHQFRLQIGMIFQHFHLLSSRTVAENLSYPLEIAHVPEKQRVKRVEELLELVGLASKRNAYPSQLSGGEKQRVGIARALANHPKVLFCDEATSALDPKTTAEILKLIQSIHDRLKFTLVVITHQMEVIKRICHKVAVMDKGRIVEQGTVADVFASPQHPLTKQLVREASHEIPPEFLKPTSPHRKLLRLHFKGEVANQPIISEIIRNFEVHVNILLGWIDRLQTLSVGTLVVELTGSPQGILDALDYLSKKTVDYEVIENGL